MPVSGNSRIFAAGYSTIKFQDYELVKTILYSVRPPGRLPKCLKEVRRVMKHGAQFAIMVEVPDPDSMWTKVVEGMTAYTPEELKSLLDDAGFTQTAIHRKKPYYATILGVNP